MQEVHFANEKKMPLITGNVRVPNDDLIVEATRQNHLQWCCFGKRLREFSTDGQASDS